MAEKRSPLKIIKPGIFDTDMEFYTVLVNDAMAADMLMHNIEPQAGQESSNRRASDVRIATYKAEIEEGFWLLSPQPIIFSEPDDNGDIEMTDGQQRLKALRQVARTHPDIAVPFTVCINAPRNAKMVLDTGKAKTPADFLRMRGVANASLVAPATKMAHCYLDVPFETLPKWRQVKVSPQAQEKFLAENQGLLSSAMFVRSTKSKISPYVAMVLHFIISRNFDVFKAEEFLTGINQGITDGVTLEDARWKLREYLATEQKGGYRFDGFELLGLSILAANDWLLRADRFAPSRAHKALRTATKFPRLWTKADLPEMPTLL